jgi:hypothetical protein
MSVHFLLDTSTAVKFRLKIFNKMNGVIRRGYDTKTT